jgi:hypothetical protein
MKYLFFVFAFAISAHASENYSAFSEGDNLYVTILGDCNHYGGQLRVAENCKEGRAMKNRALMCSAELSVIKTEMGCPNGNVTPKVLTLSLDKAKVAREAETLNLEYNGSVVEVQLHR